MTVTPTSRPHPRRVYSRPKHFRPRIEILEDRTLLATAIVHGLGLLTNPPLMSLEIAAVTIPGPRLSPQVSTGGTVASFALSGLPFIDYSGVAEAVTITAKDALGNTDVGYLGTLHFHSSDASAQLPADYTFQPTDQGTQTCSITFLTPGVQSLIVNDTVTKSARGSQFGVSVAPAQFLEIIGEPKSPVAGFANSVTVKALDPGGVTATGYGGTIHFNSSDGAARLPTDYTFTPADNGVHTFSPGVSFGSSGAEILTVSDTTFGNVNAEKHLNVLPAQFLVVSGLPGSPSLGVPYSFTVTAKDPGGVVDSDYTGTVHLSSSDTAAGLPVNYAFTAADAGSHTFTGSVTFKTSGSQTVTATDANSSLLFGTSQPVNVINAQNFALSGFPPVITPGAQLNITVTAKDGLGHTVTGYLGTVKFMSSDPAASFSLSYTFTPADQGTHTFHVIFRTLGVQSFFVGDTFDAGLFGQETSLQVGSLAPSKVVISGPGATTAGDSQNITVSVEDSQGNVVTSYTGTLHFTSTDPHALLPKDYTFTSNDAGVHTFSATLVTAGDQTITATDLIHGAITGAVTGIKVSPDLADRLSLTVPASARAGDLVNVTVAAHDRYGNVVPTFVGRIQLTGTDAKGAGLPATYHFTAADMGTHTFTGIMFTTAGLQSVTASGLGTANVGSAAAQIETDPAAASIFQIVPLGAGTTATSAGQSYAFQVTVLDRFNNIATDYLGQVTVTTSAGSNAPYVYQFLPGDAGQHVFSVIFKTATTQSLTVTDSSNAGLTALLPGIAVNAGTASHFAFSLPKGIMSGQPFQVSVTALDDFGNIATGYRGTVRFASTDSFANLPINTPFTSLDQGVHTFTVAFNSDSRQYLTVTDAANSITFTTSNIVHNPAPILSSLSQPEVVEGNGDLTLTLTGSNFVHSASVLVNGAAVATTFLSSMQLQVVLPAALLSAPKTISPSVTNPTPGGGTSSPLALGVKDAPLDVTAETVNLAQDQPFSAVVATFEDEGPADPRGDYQALIDWGDGTISAGTVSPAADGTFTVTGSHNYLQEGEPQIAVTVTSAEGAQITADGLANVVSLTQSQLITSEESLTVPPGELVATLMGMNSSATLTRSASDQGLGPTTVFLADYRSNPQTSKPNNANYYDIRVTGVSNDDELTVVYHYDPSIQNPVLSYYDPNSRGYKTVKGDDPNGGYVIDTTNHTITVVYGADSKPAITHLHGTVFAVVLFDEIGSGGGSGTSVVQNQPTQTPASVTPLLVALETHGSGGGDSGSAFSTEATFLSNNQLVLAVTPSTESQTAVSRASLSQTSGTADGDANTDDPYSYWLRLLGEELFQQWLQLSQAPLAAPADEATVQAVAKPTARPIPQERAALTTVFEEPESFSGSTTLAPAFEEIMLPSASFMPTVESSDRLGPQLAMAATVAGLGFAEMRAFQNGRKENRVTRSRPKGLARALGFTELPDRT
jgi:hypothetical protein